LAGQGAANPFGSLKYLTSSIESPVYAGFLDTNPAGGGGASARRRRISLLKNIIKSKGHS
jgi:hypothetical protein